MRRTKRWMVAALFIGSSFAVLAPAGGQGIYAVEPVEGPPGTQVTVTGHLLDCYGGPGEITSYYGFPDRVAYYWNPRAMSSDEGGLLYETYDADPNDKSGLVELASWEFGESGWTLTFSVPGDAAPGTHYNVVAFEPRCQRFVRNADGTEVEEDRNADNFVTTFCVTDPAGDCPTVPSGGAGAQPEGGTGAATTTDTGGSDGGGDDSEALAIAGGLILMLLGGVGLFTGGKKPPSGPQQAQEDQRPEADKDPCRDRRDAFDTAKVEVNSLGSTIQELIRIRSELDMEWVKTLKSSYYTAAVDVGFLAGSALSKVGEAAVKEMGAELITAAATRKLIENTLIAAAVKTLGKEVTKDVAKALQGQGISWADLVLKPAGAGNIEGVPSPDGALKKFLQNTIEDSLTRRKMDEYMKMGLRATGADSKWYAITKARVVETYAKPMADVFGHTLSVLSMGSGVRAGMKKTQLLRKNIAFVDDQLAELQPQFDEAVNAADLARHALNLCLGHQT